SLTQDGAAALGGARPLSKFGKMLGADGSGLLDAGDAYSSLDVSFAASIPWVAPAHGIHVRFTKSMDELTFTSATVIVRSVRDNLNQPLATPIEHPATLLYVDAQKTLHI